MFYKIELNNLMSICRYLHFSINRKYDIFFLLDTYHIIFTRIRFERPLECNNINLK